MALYVLFPLLDQRPDSLSHLGLAQATTGIYYVLGADVPASMLGLWNVSALQTEFIMLPKAPSKPCSDSSISLTGFC